jgi:hypothetical protein
MKWKENEKLVLRNRGGVFPGNERKQADCCARKQRNSTTVGTTHTSVVWSHGHGARGPLSLGPCAQPPYWVTHSFTQQLTGCPIGRFTDCFADRVSEWCVETNIQWMAECFSLWLPEFPLTEQLGVSPGYSHSPLDWLASFGHQIVSPLAYWLPATASFTVCLTAWLISRLSAWLITCVTWPNVGGWNVVPGLHSKSNDTADSRWPKVTLRHSQCGRR